MTDSEEVRIAILDDFHQVAARLADWRRLGEMAKVDIFTDNVTGAALVERLQPYDVVMVVRERSRFDRATIESLPRLRLLLTAGMRNRSIDLDACRDHDILVCGTEGGSMATAELTWGLIIGLMRRIPQEDGALRAGSWQAFPPGFDLQGKTLGLLGLGRLGGRVAAIGQAFGMEVIAWSQNLTEETAASRGCRRVDKDELFRLSDVLSVHLVLSERTRALVGRRELALMQPSAFLVNTSRAPIIDEIALVAALSEHRLAGAGLDVFDREPLPPDAPIRSAPNTILTPHLGYATEDTYRVFFTQALEDIEAWRAGSPIRKLAAG